MRMIFFFFLAPITPLLIWKTKNQKKQEKILTLSWMILVWGSYNLVFQLYGNFECVC